MLKPATPPERPKNAPACASPNDVLPNCTPDCVLANSMLPSIVIFSALIPAASTILDVIKPAEIWLAVNVPVTLAISTTKFAIFATFIVASGIASLIVEVDATVPAVALNGPVTSAADTKRTQ